MKVSAYELRAGDRVLYAEPHFTEDGDPVYDEDRLSEIVSVERDRVNRIVARYRYGSTIYGDAWGSEWIERDVPPDEEEDDE